MLKYLYYFYDKEKLSPQLLPFIDWLNDCPVPWLFDNIPAGLVPHRTANDQLAADCC